ncbi:MAG: DMT family transporter [Halodesulfovibrio sp.]
MPVSLRCFGNALRSPRPAAASDPSPALSAGASPRQDTTFSPACTAADTLKGHVPAHARSDQASHDRDGTCDMRGGHGSPTTGYDRRHERQHDKHDKHDGQHGGQHNAQHGGQLLKARLCMALAMVIVGSSVVTGKYVTTALPVNASLWLRFCLASAVMLVILFRKEGGLPRSPLRDYGIMFAQAACGGFLFNVLLLEGLRHTDAATAGIITATGPACALLVSCVVLRESFTRRAALAVCLAVSGIALLHAPDSLAQMVRSLSDGLSGLSAALASGLTPDLSGLSGGLKGTLFVVGAVMSESLFLLLGKRMSRPVSPLGVSTMLCVFGAVQFAPQGIAELAAQGLAAFDVTGWLVLVWYALGITVGAYLLWFSGVAHVRGAEAGVYTGVMPLSAMLLAALLLDTPIRWQHLAGCTAVLLGIAAAAVPVKAGRAKALAPENGQ